MSPTYKPGQIVAIVWRGSVNIGDVVIAVVEGREVLKRVSDVREREVYLLGDNATKSRDSRRYGWVPKKDVVGKVIPQRQACLR